MNDARGSIWRRWDIHLHSPGTALADRYPEGSLPEFIERVNAAEPQAAVLGITDYLSLRCYAQVREAWSNGLLPGVDFIFANIEFRLSPPTRKHKGVNLHLLVDPSDARHISMMEQALARLSFEYGERQYSCGEEGIRDFGFAFDPTIEDPVKAYECGVNQFKVEFQAFRNWYRGEGWVRANSLVAVSNKEQDGVSGLSTEHGFGAVREEMLRFSDLVLSGNEADRNYWLGLGTDGPGELARKYGGRMACLHGSDAHSLDEVLNPALDRRCWIRADPTFEGLRQVLFGPEERVAVAPEPPSRARDVSIDEVQVEAPWFSEATIPLNRGLVSIIGPRGSGKTALADLIALGADAYQAGPASFLAKAVPEAMGAKVGLTWRSGEAAEKRIVGLAPETLPRVRYLSQHFVEQLCSEDGASERLVEEVESVIFEALDITERAEASSFAELRDAVTEASQRRISELRGRIAECSELIAREHDLRDQVEQKRRRHRALAAEIDGILRSLSKIVLKAKTEKAEKLQKLQEEKSKLEGDVSALKTKLRRLEELERDLDLQAQKSVDAFAQLRTELIELGISQEDVSEFRVGFAGNYETILAARRNALSAEIRALADGCVHRSIVITQIGHRDHPGLERLRTLDR